MKPTRRDAPFREAMRLAPRLRRRDGLAALRARRLRHPELRAAQRHPARRRPEDPRGLRRRRRPGHRDQHVRRQPLLPRAARPRRTRCAPTTSRARASRARRPARTSGSPARSGPPGSSPAWPTRAELELVARPTFAEQAAALVEGGVDLFVLETFRHLEEIRIAIEAARRRRPRAADHRVDGLRPERDRRRRVDARSRSPTTLRDLGRRRDRRQLRRRPAARARHRRADARRRACRSACSPTPACPAPSTAACSTWRRRSTSTCSRAA